MRPKKSLGQYFLRCSWVAEKIVAAANLSKEDIVVEVGPGGGALTRVLVKNAKRVIAVEKDERMADGLDGALRKEGIKNVEVVKGDILKIFPDIFETYELQANSYKLIGNIPYYLTSRLFRIILAVDPQPTLIVFTVQKEVAERICAVPPRANLLGLSVQAFGTPRIIAEVPSSCFSPQPKVTSAIIRISDISNRFFQENGIKKDRFFAVIRAGFSQKRKFLTNTLQKIASKTQVKKALKNASLPPTARPEELSLGHWAKVVSCLK